MPGRHGPPQPPPPSPEERPENPENHENTEGEEEAERRSMRRKQSGKQRGDQGHSGREKQEPVQEPAQEQPAVEAEERAHMSDTQPSGQQWPASSAVSGTLPDLSADLDVAEFDTMKLALPDIAHMLAQQREEEARRREALARLYHALADDLNGFESHIITHYQARALELGAIGFPEDVWGALRDGWRVAKRLERLHEQAARLLRDQANESDEG